MSSSATVCRRYCQKQPSALQVRLFSPIVLPIQNDTVWWDLTNLAEQRRLKKNRKYPSPTLRLPVFIFMIGKWWDIAANLNPSARGELEITDVNRAYLEQGQLAVEQMGRGFAWLDTGTPDSLVAASNFVATLEKRQGLRISCPEEIAFNQGFIDRNQLEKIGEALGKSDYAKYIQALARTN